MEEFILASSSPRRIEILKNLGLNFKVVPSNFEEVSQIKEPRELVKYFSKCKALDVSHRINTDKIIIAADTVVSKDGKIMGKPKSQEDAFDMLKFLSNSEHQVITGLCLVNKKNNTIVTDYEETNVYFNNLTEDDIWKYIKTGEPMDKAGSYGIQGIGGVFVKKIDGCYFNVVGLPVSKLFLILRRMGINLLVKE